MNCYFSRIFLPPFKTNTAGVCVGWIATVQIPRHYFVRSSNMKKKNKKNEPKNITNVYVVVIVNLNHLMRSTGLLLLLLSLSAMLALLLRAIRLKQFTRNPQFGWFSFLSVAVVSY